MECTAQLEIIVERSDELKSVAEDPVRLPECLNLQKKRITHVMSSKDEIISKLRNEYIRLNDDYEFNANKQVIKILNKKK